MITTAGGTLHIRQPEGVKQQEKFRSKLVKPYRRRSEGLDSTFVKLFVEGLATRDFEPALRAFVGEDAPLSPSSISRLNKRFAKEFAEWGARKLEGLEILYVWVDGVYLKAGLSDEKLCALVVIGSDRVGKKHLLAIGEG
ncbi:MAG TPA: transposase [Aridibacter sp.]|nr:transposase [Aridibacter sp.]